MLLKELRGPIVHTAFLESTGNAASTGNLPAFRAQFDCQVTAAALVPSAAITADGTNFATYTLTRHTAGASAATVATRAWSATNSVALTEESMTLSGTAANLLLTAGDTLSIVKTVAASGLLIPACLLVVTYKLTGV
ncbi:MAG TPA: hypothetical protein VGD39_19025 [Nocardioides sp.]